jgi:signal peptidase I
MFFGLFDSVEKKMRTNASTWLELAEKVFHYRRDVISETERTALVQATETLRRQLGVRDDASKLKLGIEALEAVLRRVGGAHYPKSTWTENVEFFLVAAIVILGVRMYFVQPFKIPTNSMWPSYNGMTPEVFATPAEEPSPAARAIRFVAMGARPFRLDAPADGEILLPVAAQARGVLKYREVAGRSWLIFPAAQREYSLLVGDRFVTTQVPLDFDFDWAARDAFFPGKADLSEAVRAQLVAGQYVDRTVTLPSGQPERIRFVRTGRVVRTGERVLSFDILTGDQLFVDRISYHFMKPKVGDGFVFRTGNIPALRASQGDQYYIKRLVGTPGDTLAIKDYTLYRNGAPITGAPAFARNATREGRYSGYRALGLLATGQSVTVPADGYFAMGDNSANSYDGRYWGPVPAKDVVGRPLVIYYPFTKRWGIAP